MIPKPPDDFVPGDDVCKSCTGVVYFNKEMKKRGELPLCIGVKSTLKRKILFDKLEAMDKQSAKNELESYICIGYSQSSMRMERTGRIPICIQGIQFQISHSNAPGRGTKQITDDSRNRNQTNINNGSNVRVEKGEAIEATVDEAPRVPSSSPRGPLNQLMNGQYTALYASAAGFATFMQKGMQKQLGLMRKTFPQITNQLPQRMFKSGGQLLTSSGKTVDRLQRGVSKMWDNWR